MLEEEPEEPEETDIHEEFAAAVRNGNISVFIEMLKRKDELELDLEHQDEDGHTVFRIAIEEGYSGK